METGEARAMATPSQKTDQATQPVKNKARPTEKKRNAQRTGEEPGTCLDSFLEILEYLSEATGLSIEDIADLLSGKDGPMGAIVLASYMQETTGARIGEEERTAGESPRGQNKVNM